MINLEVEPFRCKYHSRCDAVYRYLKKQIESENKNG